MKSMIILSAIFLSIVACNVPGSRKEVENSKLSNYQHNDAYSKMILPYNSNLSMDSSKILFYYLQAFDTSFFLHLSIKNGEIFGTYYEPIPIHSGSLEEFHIGSANVVFFTGYSFNLKKNAWSPIVDRAKSIIEIDSTVKAKTCFDCPEFFLSYDGKLRFDNSKNQKSFQILKEYLKDSIINEINVFRKGF